MTNYDTLKEYEAHHTPVPSYEEWVAAYECQLEENELVTTLKNMLLNLIQSDEGTVKDLKEFRDKLPVTYDTLDNLINYFESDLQGYREQINEVLK